MYNIKTITLALALAAGATLSAANDALFFTFRHYDGTVTQIEIPFPEETAEPAQMPTMKFTDTSVEITIPSETPGEAPAVHSIGVEDLQNSTFDSTASLQGAVVESSTVFTVLEGNRIRVAAPGEIADGELRVYDLSGKHIACPVAIDGSVAVVSLDELGAGVYIIVYQDNNIKVTKK